MRKFGEHLIAVLLLVAYNPVLTLWNPNLLYGR
jgi:hypothetical protein